MSGPTWDLEPVFAGGVTGRPFQDRLVTTRMVTQDVRARVRAIGDSSSEDAWVDLLRGLLTSYLPIGDIWAFAGCHFSANASSAEARFAAQSSREILTEWLAAWADAIGRLDDLDDAAFARIAGRPEIASMHEWLENERAGRFLRQPRQLEELATTLEREALHGWGELYDVVSGRIRAEADLPDGRATLDAAGLQSRFGDPDPRVRSAAFAASAIAWESESLVCATALTHITGHRQTRLDRVSQDPLAPSLYRNRTQRETLDAMWRATEAVRPSLLRYLNRKAAVLGKEKLDWSDLAGPLPRSGPSTALSWDDAVGLVADAFTAFDPEMGAFVRHAVEHRWIEAEERPGKRQGGFCTRFPGIAESRIFLTFGGTLRGTVTLAHELGHAWHNRFLFAEPEGRRRISSAIAETASTFGEALFRRVLEERGTSDDDRLVMLDQQLMAASGFAMDIRARFEFELRLYEMRRKGAFSPEALSAEMVAAQRKAYGDALASWNPHYWMSKLHYYMSHFGFYNWPYTFGYLLSAALFAEAQKQGEAFVPKYRTFLQTSGWMDSEALGQAALGRDMRDEAFWAGALAPIEGLVDRFVAATADRVR